MAETNRGRAMVAHLHEVCRRRGIQVTAFSDDWIFCLQKDGRAAHVFGYDFSLNSAVAKMICKDKSATSDLLGFHGIPRIEHRIFHGPQLVGYVSDAGGWREMLSFLEQHPKGIVCKPNEGTGGNAVFLVLTPAQLEAAVYQILGKSRSVCLSPFQEIGHEYRVALLCGEIEFIYRKIRPAVQGDGSRTIRDLLLWELSRAEDFPDQLNRLKMLGEMKIDWARIPAAGESVKINWRHNLGQGSKPELLTEGDAEWKTVGQLAVKAAGVLGIRLASVDVASTPEGLKVLEINSGIMMESLVRIHPEGWEMAGRFYDRIVCMALGIEMAA